MARINTIYMPEHKPDYYDDMYAEVIRLNGDCEPFPQQIETFFGQKLNVRDEDGRLKTKIKIVNVAKESKSYYLKDNYSNFPYINYIAVKCWLDMAIDRSPASLNHLSTGFHALKVIQLSSKDFDSETKFSKEVATQLAGIIISNIKVQQVWLSIRLFANYAIENDFWGFDESIIFKLDEIKIPNTGSKLRVSLLDHEHGPFTRSEVSEIAQAIHNDDVTTEERVLVKLVMQFGLRPIQLALLREDDIFYDSKKLAWYINVPRVKGRVAQLRRNQNNFILRELPNELVEETKKLIENESLIQCTDEQGNSLPRPLFKSSTPNKHYLSHPKIKDYAWHLESVRISGKFIYLSRKLNIISRHVKDEDGVPALLKLNCYRFRYTLGTRMVMKGKTPEEVAITLDHGSTHSVNHYFRYNRDLIDFIDDSFESSSVIKNAVSRWQNYMISEDDDTVAGSLIRISDIVSLGKCLKQTRCEYHPTVSCYSCGKFRPFKSANHEAQLEVIKAERDFVYQNSSGPVQHQLDEALQGAIEIVEAQKLLKGESNE